MTKAFVVAGIGYGDEGKGTVTDALVRRHGASMVVRYNGGAQAAHNVVTPNGVHHTFAQFGSGALAGATTYLGEHMVVDPPALIIEQRALAAKGGCVMIAIHPRALLVNPFQVGMNRIREIARGADRHGSTGRGIGEAVCDAKLNSAEHAIRAADIHRPDVLEEKIAFWRRRKELDAGAIVREYRDAPHSQAIIRAVEAWFGAGAAAHAAWWVQRCREIAKFVSIGEPSVFLPQNGTVVFEGAQGVLLDEEHGFHPYTTWSKTTFAHALAMLQETTSAWDIRRIGVTRAYATRHGPGPFPTEDIEWTAPAMEHNQNGLWQGPMRFGPFDLVTAGYAVDCLGGVDELAVTCLDHVDDAVLCCSRYRDAHGSISRRDVAELQRRNEWAGRIARARIELELAGSVEKLLDRVSAELDAPITIRSYGPTERDKRWSR